MHIYEIAFFGKDWVLFDIRYIKAGNMSEAEEVADALLDEIPQQVWAVATKKVLD